MKKASIFFLTVAMVMMTSVSPLFAGPGNLGQLPNPLPYPQIEVTPDFLLEDEPAVTVTSDGKEATIEFKTVVPTPAVLVHYGPYMPDADLRLARYRRTAKEEGVPPEGSASHSVDLNLSKFESTKYNPGNLPGTMCYRVEIYNPEWLTTCFYDRRFEYSNSGQEVAITQGPFVDQITPNSVIISWNTDCVSTGNIVIGGNPYTDGLTDTHHEVKITDLAPGTTYDYYVKANGTTSPTFSFKTPRRFQTRFKFACMSDCREGVGGGERVFNGVNYKNLSGFFMDAYRKGAHFILFGGDLVNGYTTNTDDYRMQLKSWKDAAEIVGHYTPIYETMGNHEIVMDVYDDGSKYGVDFDKDNKSEEIFAQEFVNPNNGPEPEIDGSPTYKENVYYFDYGNSRFIAFNTNYWWSSHPEDFGGNLEGYVMDRQLEWIENVLDDAQRNPLVRHIFMFAHEPAFPNGGHVQDAQWYNGGDPAKNQDHAGNPLDRRFVPQRRDELWKAISKNGKVRAVIFGDEHAYNRMLVDDGLTYVDPVTKETIDPDFPNPVWQIISGGAGAPYYAQDTTVPWTQSVKTYSTQKHYCLFEVIGPRVTLMVYSDTGQLIDRCWLK
ncbi:MAG: hypothetical protein BA865_09025 [Desulfobacterales bacterium S5133MH4]|nr:MAG: hypothetical protein BA865_09025 [Desulfobacterales bacterium S5133MH4]